MLRCGVFLDCKVLADVAIVVAASTVFYSLLKHYQVTVCPGNKKCDLLVVIVGIESIGKATEVEIGNVKLTSVRINIIIFYLMIF